MNRDLLILSTEASAYFADLIRDKLSAMPIKIERKTFGGGERYFRLDISERDFIMGKDVVFVGSTHTDDDFMELSQVGSALAMYGAHSLIFCIPFFGYSRMERADKPGEVVTAKTHARMLSAIPQARKGNTFLLLDTHVPNLVHYFEGNCLRYELSAEEMLTKYFEPMITHENLVFGSTDLGRPKVIKRYAKRFSAPIALIDKDKEEGKTSVAAIIGDVSNKTVIMCDDLCGSGTTAANAAEAYLNEGARSVYFVVNHFSINDFGALNKLVVGDQPPIRQIITTNSHPMSVGTTNFIIPERFDVIDVSTLFVEEIKKILGR